MDGRGMAGGGPMQAPPPPPPPVGGGVGMPLGPPQFIGSRIALLSKMDIRYEGILYNINPQDSTVQLQSVRSFGTEGRVRADGGPPVPPSQDVYDFIVFRGSDIKDLKVLVPAPSGYMPPPPPSGPLYGPSGGIPDTTGRLGPGVPGPPPPPSMGGIPPSAPPASSAPRAAAPVSAPPAYAAGSAGMPVLRSAALTAAPTAARGVAAPPAAANGVAAPPPSRDIAPRGALPPSPPKTTATADTTGNLPATANRTEHRAPPSERQATPRSGAPRATRAPAPAHRPDRHNAPRANRTTTAAAAAAAVTEEFDFASMAEKLEKTRLEEHDILEQIREAPRKYDKDASFFDSLGVIDAASAPPQVADAAHQGSSHQDMRRRNIETFGEAGTRRRYPPPRGGAARGGRGGASRPYRGRRRYPPRPTEAATNRSGEPRERRPPPPWSTTAST